MTLTSEQIERLKQGEPIQLSVSELEEELVVIRASSFRRLQEVLDDQSEKEGWAHVARKARDSWCAESDY